jgi:hypothetical protein
MQIETMRRATWIKRSAARAHDYSARQSKATQSKATQSKAKQRAAGAQLRAVGAAHLHHRV